jgi:hypothetical protein
MLEHDLELYDVNFYYYRYFIVHIIHNFIIIKIHFNHCFVDHLILILTQLYGIFFYFEFKII